MEVGRLSSVFYSILKDNDTKENLAFGKLKGLMEKDAVFLGREYHTCLTHHNANRALERPLFSELLCVNTAAKSQPRSNLYSYSCGDEPA